MMGFSEDNFPEEEKKVDGMEYEKSLKTVFTSKYTKKVLRQTILQAIDNTTFVLSKDILLSPTR